MKKPGFNIFHHDTDMAVKTQTIVVVDLES